MYHSLKTKRDNDNRNENFSTSWNMVPNKRNLTCKSDREDEKQLSANTSASLMNNPSMIKEQIQEKYR